MALPPHLADLESRLASRVDEALGEYRRTVEQRLSEMVERLSDVSRELPPPVPPSLFEGIELEALDSGPRREASRDALGTLLDAHRALDRARSQGEVLDALLDHALRWSDRAAVVLVRDEELVGWGERGFGPRGLSGRPLTQRQDVRERLVPTRGCRELDAGAAAELAAELDLEAAGEALLLPLVLRDQIAAVVWADRRESAPEAPALQLLVSLAAQRLELQALTDRAQTPTLFREVDSAAEPLPLWRPPATPVVVATPAEPAAPEEIAPVEEPQPAPEPTAPGGETLEIEAVVEPEIEAAAAPEVEELPAEAGAPQIEAPEEEAEAEAWEPIADEAPAAIEGDVVELEAQPEFEYEAEAEPAEEVAPEPAEEPATPPDMLGTVRIATPELPPAAEPAPEETTAPHRIEAAPAAQEPAEAAPSVDPTGDATVLTAPPPAAVEPPAQPAAAAAPAPEEDPMDRTSSRGGRSTQVAPPPDIDGPGLAFVAGRVQRALSGSPVHEEAKRLARLLISEIKLYNEEQVLEGRRNRDLYHRLREDIDRSRQIFDERVDPAVRAEVDYFQQELVRSLAGGDPRALGI